MIELLKSIPATYRRGIYAAYTLALFVTGLAQAVTDPDPDWLGPVMDGLAYVGVAIGGLAAVNAGNPGPAPVPDDNNPPPHGEAGAVDLMLVLVLLVTGVVAILLFGWYDVFNIDGNGRG